MTNPSEGGSYRREPDGSLTRLDVATPVTPKSETTAEPPSETQDVESQTDTPETGKKGKA